MLFLFFFADVFFFLLADLSFFFWCFLFFFAKRFACGIGGLAIEFQQYFTPVCNGDPELSIGVDYETCYGDFQLSRHKQFVIGDK